MSDLPPHLPDTDAQEVAWLRAAQQDPQAFRPLYERYVGRVYAYCLRRIENRAEAEDLTSQTFTRALSGLSSYQGGNVAAWLFRIAHNLVVNHYRQRGRGPSAALPLDALEHSLAGDYAPPLEQVIHTEQLHLVREYLATLPQDQQDLLALKLSAGLNATEIAAAVGKTPGAVRVALHRIIANLRAELMPHLTPSDGVHSDEEATPHE